MTFETFMLIPARMLVFIFRHNNSRTKVLCEQLKISDAYCKKSRKKLFELGLLDEDYILTRKGFEVATKLSEIYCLMDWKP